MTYPIQLCISFRPPSLAHCEKVGIRLLAGAQMWTHLEVSAILLQSDQLPL